MNIKQEFYTELKLMNLAKHLDDEEAMEILVRPHVTERVNWNKIILVTSRETGVIIGFDLFRRIIDKEMCFTDTIRLRANEIAARYAGCWDSDLASLLKELRQIGIEISDIIDEAGSYAFTYKGNGVVWCSFTLDEYQTENGIKLTCYFG